MKTIITMYAAIICACAIAVTSCSESPVDQFINKMESSIQKLEKMKNENNPSNDEIKSFQDDAGIATHLGKKILDDYDLANTHLSKDQFDRLSKIYKWMQENQNPFLRSTYLCIKNLLTRNL
jgi:hypothetical protein